MRWRIPFQIVDTSHNPRYTRRRRPFSMAYAVLADAPGVKSGVEALSKRRFQLLSMIFGSSTEVSMARASNVQAINDYWGRDGLGQAILDALAASGKNLKALTIDALAPLDQFHGGGKAATVRLARLAGLHSGMRVL